jgi:hypothetical protein
MKKENETILKIVFLKLKVEKLYYQYQNVNYLILFGKSSLFVWILIIKE